MRVIYNIALCLTLIGTLSLTACSHDVQDPTDDSQDVVINIAAGSRSGNPQTDYSHIGSLRVLGYKTSNGLLEFNESVLTWATDNNISGATKEIKVKTGTYTLIFIANEHLDSDLSAILANNAQIGILSSLRRLSFSHTAFLTSGQYVPMLTQVDNVTITGDHSANCDPNDDFKFDPVKDAWVLSLNRLAVKLRLHLFIQPGDPIYGTTIHFNCNNIPTKVFLLPQTDNSAFQTTFADNRNTYKSVVEQRDDITLPTAFTKPDGYSVFGPGTGTASNVIILPENYLAGANNIMEKGVLLSITNVDGSITRTGRLITATDDYSLTRNTFLDIAGTTRQPQADIEFFINVVDWEDEQIDPGTLH